MLFLREKRNWIPLYLSLIVFFFIKFNYKKATCILLLALATIGISDTLSSKIIKPSVQRPRPCHENSTLPHPPNLLVKACGGGYSFTSSHATNHFALAVFLAWILAPFWKYSKPFFLLWAACISYAQVYVGLHYPFDVVSGGILGAIIGFGMYKCFLRFYPVKMCRENV